MENESYFKTVTSIQSNRSEYQLSKPIKSNDKPLKESDLALYCLIQIIIKFLTLTILKGLINLQIIQFIIYFKYSNQLQQVILFDSQQQKQQLYIQQQYTILIIYLVQYIQQYQAARDKCANKQNEKLSSPLFQVTTLITNAAPLHKPTVKTTQYSNQPTSVFDFTDNRKEQNFKPHCIKVTEPGNNSDLVYKQQLKTSNLPNRENLYRNPITNGDPKSEYNRSTKTPFPKNQINFVG